MKKSRLLLPAALACVALAASAVPLKTDVARSSVAAVFKQMNVPVEAKFKKFNAQIDYDPVKPDASKATVDIDTASLDVGEAEMNKEVAKKEWFDSAKYPKASFVSSSIKPAGAGKLTVAGKLLIKGKSMDVTFPLTVKADGGKQVFEGALPIRRLAFNIGEGEWKDTSMVADEVVIKFRVTAAQ
ncbi:polyisoprenoid-binding protein [Massilia eurypsychrophila]|jgi:polyisoprenoid-binding protein YceI|uniref:Polyisoprenoid-binding protein n=1 Tax=Massilia eurypsychrophila TaxID=1485217 RepID=A0A2G8TKB2_9BURK|nr:YceI family protein [Massilia eurypsychrophila]PIL46483.1 polyisoprenoid-binding protein [Massilia eurypsychrophila]